MAVARLMVVWVLAMVATPILIAVLGQEARPWIIVGGVVVQAAVVSASLVARWGWQATLRVTVAVLVLAWLVERLGSSTGLPFGDYHYTQLLQPQVLGVPVIVPLAWMMMLPAAWAVGDVVARGGRGPVFIVASSLAFAAWDLFLDPQMVAWGFWQWEHAGAYFGIPISNYLGWVLAGATLTALIRPPVALPSRSLLLVYAITWVLQTIGLIAFWRLPGPAAGGFVAMGIMLLWARRRSRSA